METAIFYWVVSYGRGGVSYTAERSSSAICTAAMREFRAAEPKRELLSAYHHDTHQCVIVIFPERR